MTAIPKPILDASAMNRGSRRTSLQMVALFGGTMFLSAFLSFSVEPMLAKMILPILGGTPAVWNTCLVFFQAALLAGYAYAHGLNRIGRTRLSIILHLTLIALVLFLLPLRLPPSMEVPTSQNPVLWLLGLLAFTIGLPFFVLSASTPILQRWFSIAEEHSDPYFLYVASNAGSLAGLLSYPLLVEPMFSLRSQRIWSVGYGLLLICVAACGVTTARAAGKSPSATDATRHSSKGEHASPKAGSIARWVVLAFVPSSLTIGITTLITTDMPAIPLFWVLPLSIYLLTFMVAFASKSPISRATVLRRLPFLLLAASFPIASGLKLPMVLGILLDLVTLFGVGLFCHGELAESRPPAEHLTKFYLWIAVGGVLGGIFNAIIAPVAFRSLVEVPIVLVLAAFLRPAAKQTGRRDSMLDVGLPVALGLGLYGIILFLQAKGFKPGPLTNVIMFGIGVEWCLSFAKRPIRFAGGLIAVFLASNAYTAVYGHILHTERSFFGVYRVANDEQNHFRRLFHAGTIHGMQSLDPANATRPYSYYSEAGPLGPTFRSFVGQHAKSQVAIVGLGAGMIGCYTPPPVQVTYYEIDPAIERIAKDPQFFTALRDCTPQANVVLGDARMALRSARDQSYDLIILDAFSGDTLPAHLVTREALGLYLSKLAPNGLLLFNVSNIYLDLSPVLASLAKDAGLAVRLQNDTQLSEQEIENGHFPSAWVVMARGQDDMGSLATDGRWIPLIAKANARVWTDDYSSVITLVRWRTD